MPPMATGHDKTQAEPLRGPAFRNGELQVESPDSIHCTCASWTAISQRSGWMDRFRWIAFKVTSEASGRLRDVDLDELTRQARVVGRVSARHEGDNRHGIRGNMSDVGHLT